MGDVQIPTLNRVGPVAPDTTGRLTSELPDFQRAVAPQTKATETLAAGAVDFFEKQAKSQAHTVATDLSNQHDMFQYTELQKAKANKGDPTGAFAEYDRKVKENYDQLLAKNQDVPDFTRSMIETNLKESQRRFFDNRSTAFSHNIEEYKDNVTTSAVKISQSSMMGASANIVPGDSTSLLSLNTELSRIEKLYLERGLANGYVTQNENKEYVPNVIVKEQIAKARSEGLYGAIENLNATGQGDKAKFILDNYGQYLDTIHAPKARSGVQTTLIKQEALGHVARASQLGPSKGLEYIDSLKDKDSSPHGLQVWDQAKKDWNTHQNIAKSDLKRQQNDNYEPAHSTVSDRMRSSTPFVDANEMRKDPIVAAHWPLMGPKQQDALIHMVEQPPTSNQGKLSAAQDSLKDGSFFKQTAAQLAETVSGMDKEDHGRYLRMWEKANSATGGELNANLTYGARKIEDELLGKKAIKPSAFSKKGYSGTELEKLNGARRIFNDRIMALPPTATHKDIDEIANKLATELAVSKAFSKPSIDKIEGSINLYNTAPTPPPPAAKNVQPTFDPEQQMKSKSGAVKKRSEWLGLYYDSHDKKFPKAGTTELEKWIEGQ